MRRIIIFTMLIALAGCGTNDTCCDSKGFQHEIKRNIEKQEEVPVNPNIPSPSEEVEEIPEEITQLECDCGC